MNICIAYPTSGERRETFITHHISCLPGKVYELVGWLPLPVDNCMLPRKAVSFFMRILHRLTSGYSTNLWISFYLKHHNIDMLLVEYGDLACFFLEGSRRAGVPLFAHFHGYDAYQKSRLGLKNDYAKLFQQVSGVGVVSKAMAAQLQSLGCPEKKISHVSYGVDMKRFSVTYPSQNTEILVFIGRFVEKKAPFHLLESFFLAQKQCPQASLVMAGDGPLLTDTQHKVKELRIEEKVIFPGRLTHEQVAETLGRARAYVQHSITASNGDSEGTPVVILEAAACGLPVISTQHAGIPDVVEDQVSGLLVGEGDVYGMANNMVRVLTDPEYAQILGHEGARMVRKKYDIQQTVENLYQLLFKLHTQNLSQ